MRWVSKYSWVIFCPVMRIQPPQLLFFLTCIFLPSALITRCKSSVFKKLTHMTAGHTATWSSWWPYLSCQQRRSKQDFTAFRDKPQLTLWRSLSNMSLIIGLKARYSHQPPGACSFKLLGQTTTSKGGTTPWTDAPRERPTYPCIASYSCSTRKRLWLPCRFDLYPTRSFEATRE